METGRCLNDHHTLICYILRRFILLSIFPSLPINGPKIAMIPKVAVLLASFNGERFIADQLATVRHQAQVDVRIFVRDDGSHDNTAAVLSEQPDVTLCGMGTAPTGSAARNFLEMLATLDFGDAEYVALADQDDLWLPNKLQRGVGCLESSGTGGYSCNLSAFDNDGRKAPWLLLKHGPLKPLDYLFQGASAGCTYILTRACADAVQQWLRSVTFPTNIGVSHDWLLYAFVRNRDLGWYCDDLALILY
ncbi:MAG: glycosyltransferase, partial [Oxalobacteraceae bacterium]